jgi:uncharacterized membrane protein HdeD (DUF308 family)
VILRASEKRMSPRKSSSQRRLAARVRVHRKVLSWAGVALASVGAATIAFPAVSTVLVGALAGWLLWFAGGVLLVVSWLIGPRRSVYAGILAGALAIAGGAFLFFNPFTGAVAVALLIGAVLIVDGAFELALALDLRPLAAWRWVLASAFASAMAGAGVAAGAAMGSQAALAMILGAAFGSTGLALVLLSLSARAPGDRLRLVRLSRPPSAALESGRLPLRHRPF